MAYFPQPDPRVRAPRVRLPDKGKVKFSLDGNLIPGVLHMLSATGGVAQFPGAVRAGELAELQIECNSGVIIALVEVLSPLKGSAASMRPFRFVALGDEDQQRLSTVITRMQDKGHGIS
jgi:hypothetical protein